ncbi:SPOSA6832_03369 [Sporobolomyces salmonicolor]|uniref:SPOSA6832_03369-mRNA-1:cds n=1 Tax=Sporidiobolus salmonicolor TaxID=5005 RepID=A0A0D6ENK7_SPOSA|nr:SPOSA6832_03369 [Sporobolomyces salmonicolor]
MVNSSEKADMDDQHASDEHGTVASETGGPSRRGLKTVGQTISLGFLGLGIIYGDIGTSPLYVLNGIFPASKGVPNKEDVVGAISAVLWALILVPLAKYAGVCLCFATREHGEGGPFAIYSDLYPPPEVSVRRRSRLAQGSSLANLHESPLPPLPPQEKRENRALTSYTTSSARYRFAGAKDFFQRSIVRCGLLLFVLFGACLTMSDGLLTPAVSVTSAVEGIAVPFPSVNKSVVGISCAILVLLFLLQMVGTKRVGNVFAPIIFIWLGTIGISGIINVTHHPGIFRGGLASSLLTLLTQRFADSSGSTGVAFDPSRAVMLFVRTHDFGLLGGIVLAMHYRCRSIVRQVLGQFSAASIRLAFIGYVFPCLVLAYLGQGARLIVEGPNVIQNVFFQSIPGGVGSGLWWFTWVIAILSAVIASQAMITATFSLVQQLARLNIFPPVKIVHTDDKFQNRVFIPSVNFLLLVGTIGLNSTNDRVVTRSGIYSGRLRDERWLDERLVGLFAVEQHGFAVSGVLLITTGIISIAIVKLKHLPVIVALHFLVGAGFIDGLFFGATALKVPHGAWFTLGLACILLILFTGWTWAKHLEDKFDETHRYRLTDVMHRAATLHLDDSQETSESVPVKCAEATDSFGIDVMQKRDHVRISTHQPKPRTSGQVGGDLEASNGAALARLPVFAFFHNSSSHNYDGAPHSFSAFLRAYPSLPQVIVVCFLALASRERKLDLTPLPLSQFLTVRVVGVPRVTDDADRFLIDRVRSFEGRRGWSPFLLPVADRLYIATIRFGYRDKLDLSHVATPLRHRIAALEQRSDPEGYEDRVQKMDKALDTAITHMYALAASPSTRYSNQLHCSLPHLYVVADRSSHRWKIVRCAPFASPKSVIRTLLIEEVYRRVKVNFDETGLYHFDDDKWSFSFPASGFQLLPTFPQQLTSLASVLRMGVTAVL